MKQNINEKNLKDFSLLDMWMYINKESLTFYRAQQREEILIIWDSERLHNVKVNRITSPYGYSTDYKLIDDGLSGKCIVGINSSELASSVKYLDIVMTSDDLNEYGDRLYKTFRVELKIDASESFILFDHSALVHMPYWGGSYVGFKSYELGSEAPYTIKEVYADYEGCYVQILDGKLGITTTPHIALEQGYYDSVKEIRVSVNMERPGPNGSKVNRKYYIDIALVMPILKPIWKDSTIRFVSSSSYSTLFEIYRTKKERGTYEIIEMERDPIYTGKMYKAPDEDAMFFKLNNICESFLNSEIDMFIPKSTDDRKSIIENFDFSRGFFIKVDNMYIGGYQFINDWNYDKEMDYVYSEDRYIGEPLTKEIAPFSQFIGSIFIYDHKRLTYPIIEGRDKFSGDWIPIISQDYAGQFNQYTGVVDMSQFRGADNRNQFDRMRIGGEEFIVSDRCYDWVIHYKNKNGGYSSYPVNGTVNITDEVKPYNVLHSFNNTRPEFEKGIFQNEIIKQYEVNLNFVPKDVAYRMDEILESPEIWLEKVDSFFRKKIIPVICTTKTTEFMQNIKVRNYSITFEGSQSRVRR